MFIDGRQIASGSTIERDVCIIGGGPAGIVIARELLGAAISVVLVESGGWRPNKLTQSLNAAELASDSRHPPPEMYRERRFGGSSTIWGGRCVPLTPSDFDSRSHVANSGWPISYDKLVPFYSRALTYCEAGEFAFDPSCLKAAEAIVEGLASADITIGLERFSPPTDFGRRFKSDLIGSPKHTLLLESTCVGLLSNDSGRLVEAVECSTLSGNKFRICAKHIVVAAGGLESVRLLAASNGTFSAGLANSSGALGRYYMSHLEGTLGRLQVAAGRRVAWNFARTRDGIYAKHHIRLSDDVQRRLQLRNMIFRLHHANPMDPQHGDPVLSLMYIAKRFILPEYRRKITTVELESLDRLPKGHSLVARHIANIAKNPWPLIKFVTSWVHKRHVSYRRMPYVALYSKQGAYPLDYNAEQTPSYDSRVSLSHDKDRFGVPKLRIDWRVCPEDIASIAVTFREMRRILARTNAAEVVYDDDALNESVKQTIAVGGHHIGTARMSADPKRGVVNTQCRTHDVENLYIAGSAVFPTSGSANPTLTIVALAIRIADQLKTASRSPS
ncbi:GMC oxidoreductase [Bradyrhizobium sp. AUGA SZCCT0283]|uniref:GMC oxidoreductase n=1 Tax=Bradyrhizobium sp. AUGA SZCCT0283 TaxID=2807671 RepID=UPI001BA52BFD|nr:GMC family oxidoreductase [Bradyrhizobium sp. AUGA SZCCT0283]MBR1279658.1 GMC family oxidoreductase [Bradyrhizobium sp. AUGA SZCCT0283]